MLVTAGVAPAVDSFLSDNPQAPEAIPYRRELMATPVPATPALAATPAPP